MSEKDDIRSFFGRSIEDSMDALYGVALRLTRNRADAEDLVAETTSRAWAKFAALEDRKRFRPWVFRILHNCFISDYRKKSVRPTETQYDEGSADDGQSDIASLLIEQPDEFLCWWADPERKFVNDALGEKIMAAIANLPQAYQMTVLLINAEGLTYDEAAAVLDVPPGTIRSRMKRGRTLLQKELWLQGQEAGLVDADNMNGQEL
jgi:RNA polymerase sigma-70 factor (ECF subfamily)